MCSLTGHFSLLCKASFVSFTASLKDRVNLTLVRKNLDEDSDRHLQIGNLQRMAWQHYNQGQFQDAFNAFYSILQMQQTVEDGFYVGETLTRLSLIAYRLGNRVQAMSYCNAALAQAKETNDIALLSDGLNLLGLIYQQSGQLKQALEVYQQVLELSVEVANEQGIGRTLNNLGAIYHSLGQSDRAQQLCLTAAGILEDTHDQEGQATALYNAGLAYQQLGQFDRARKCLLKCQAIRIVLGDPIGEAEIFSVLASIHLQVDEPFSALLSYQEALTLYEGVGGHCNEKAVLLEHIGWIYEQQELDLSAFECYQRATTLFETSANSIGAKRAISKLEQTYTRMGNPEYALECPQVLLANVKCCCKVG
jgi:tetratricopeptide (TPR) repeat protein